MRRLGLGIITVLALAVVSACSSKTAETKSQARGPSTADVGKVVVTIANTIDADGKKVLGEVNAVSRLQAAVLGELTKAGKFKAASPRALEIQVTEFRLRSGTAVFLAGIMAGVDSLNVQVTVRDGSSTGRQYKTGDSSTGAFAGLTSSSRFQPMADAVAVRVAEEL
ncbi:MAG: DUF4410 domain-containing protein [Candidatus Binatia bacterium]